jgi:hypothetical protein
MRHNSTEVGRENQFRIPVPGRPNSGARAERGDA